MNKVFTLLIITFIANFVFAGSFTSVNDGSFTDPATWNNGWGGGAGTEGVDYPGPNDDVTIKDDVTLSLTKDLNLASISNASNAGSFIVSTTGSYTLSTTNNFSFSGGTTATGIQFLDGVNLQINGNMTIARMPLSIGQNTNIDINGNLTTDRSIEIGDNSTVDIEGLLYPKQTTFTLGDDITITTGSVGTANPSLDIDDTDITMGTGVTFTVNQNMDVSNQSNITIPTTSRIDVEETLELDGSGSTFSVTGVLTANDLNIVAGQQDFQVMPGGIVDITNDVSTAGTADLTINNDGTFKVGHDMNIDGDGVTVNGTLEVDNILNVTNGNNDITGTGTVTAGTYTGTGKIFGSTSGDLDPGETYYAGDNGEAWVLPIELISFTAKANNNNVELNWATATEENNDYFTIERSTDGISFEVIATVIGAGNSSTTINYSYTDYYPLTGVSYYRIKQTDFDGKYSYTPTASTSLGGNTGSLESKISSYPNPYQGGDYLILNTSSLEAGVNMQINIVALNGQNVLSVNVSNPENQKVNLAPYGVSNLPKGLYVIGINKGNGISHSKLIIE